MSQENVEIVREHFEATNRGDYAFAVDQYADDVELVLPPGDLLSGTYSGREAVSGFFADWFRAFGGSQHFDLREIRGVGDAVVVVAHHEARGRRSGAAISGEFFYSYWLSDGKIRRVLFHASRDDALEAVGLRE